MSDTPKVRHRPIRPFDRGTLIDDVATFYVNNKVFHGFKNITVQRNLMSVTGSFTITLIDVWRGVVPFEIKTGDRIHCHLGNEAIFEGYVDVFNINITSGSTNITIDGRDRTADLVDCAHLGASEFNNLNLSEIAKQMIAPFGLEVINTNNVDVGKVFEKFTVRQGETVFEALNRGAKQRQLILLSSPHGNLVFDKKGVTRAGTELVEGVNIELTGARFNDSQRFSQYIVKGQKPGVIADLLGSTSGKGEAFDAGINRYRPTVIIAEQSSDTDDAQQRAEFEASFKIAKAFSCTVALVDWKKTDGKVWKVNEIVRAKIPSIGINSDLLIKSVSFKLSDSGRATDLELIRKDAFDFKKEIKKEDDLLTRLGVG